MILSAHQPVYLPGIILFNKIALSDAFVLLSDVQFERSSWQMRNKIRSGDSESYLSVPIDKSHKFGQLIAETSISGGVWKDKHIKSLFFTYKKRPYFNSYFPELEAILQNAGENICELNTVLIRYFCRCLGITTAFHDSRDLPTSGAKNALLISICRAIGATAYVSNIGARGYIDEQQFKDAGISHLWQDFEHPIYEQGAPFLTNLSVVDILFNLGPSAAGLVRNCGKLVEMYPTEAGNHG